MTRLTFIFFALLTSLVAVGQARSASVSEGRIWNIQGNWFSCEFAHSQIPPTDGCKMLDDDGFSIAKGIIDHIKVTDSTEERGCRRERKGQCFKRDREQVVISRSQVGPINATKGGFKITYWGCAQTYSMSKHVGYFEIKPSGSRCLWARDKRYFISRYKGKVVAQQ